MVRPKKRVQIPPLSPVESAALIRRIDEIARNFSGQLEELESALGMLLLGRLFGWKVVALVHNKRTIRKYEEILGIQIREEFSEVGPLAYKSVGYRRAEKLGNFWKAVSGDFKIENRRELVD